MSKRWIGVLAAACLVSAAPAAAQVFTPTFLSPQLVPARQGEDIGVYLNGGPGDFSIEGILRRNLAGGDRALLLLGAEFRTPVQIPDAPVITAITGGVQGVLGGGSAAGVHAGASIGYPFAEGALAAVPYVNPRLALVNRFGAEDLDLEILADFGVDVTLEQRFVFRFAFGLGSPTARWGMGFAWR
jgi:hypothetical protein